ncbi:MAG: hypothetical protein ABR591_08545 [Candidatus Velthaea sp.]
MTNDTLASIEELLRIPSPCPEPQALACDGTDIWVGSADTSRLYGIRGNTGAVFEEAVAPGVPIGMVVTGDALRLVLSQKDDARFIRRYVFGHGFKTEGLACPDDTGSFLAWDGDNLFLSQRFNKRIVQIDMSGDVMRAIPVPREITGMVIVNGRFFLMTTESRTSDDYRLLRMDARKDEPEVVELASVPFWGRSLAWDGTKFWTNCRKENTIVAFSAIGV